MKILFDQGVPAPLRKFLTNHDVQTAFELGWSSFKNGELIASAEANGFMVFVTTDQNLRYQQNLTGRRIAVFVLLSTSWPKIQKHVPHIIEIIETAEVGVYVEIPVSSPP